MASAADALFYAAQAAWSRGDGAGADKLCREALAADQNHVETLLLLGEIRLAAAPDEPLAHMLMAHALRRAKRPADAIKHAEVAVTDDPTNAEWRTMLGNALRDAGRLDEAIVAFRRARDDDPTRLETSLNLAAALVEAEDGDGALDVISSVVRSRADNAEAWLCLGNAQRLRGDVDAACDAYREATKLAPNDARAFSNLGVAAQQCGGFGEARASFERAIAFQPDLAEAHKNRAMLSLLQGDFASGFEAFQWRWKEGGTVNRPRPFLQPAWYGGALAGKTILIWGEQGVGDEIMFASLLPEIINAAGHCVVECEARLLPIFARSFPDAEIVVRTERPHPRLGEADIDLQCAAGDACRWLRRAHAAFGAPTGYLQAPLNRIAALRKTYDELGAGPKIGVAWHSRTPQWGAIKSAPLDQWAPILTCPDVVWIDLQYGDHTAELATIGDSLGIAIHHDSSIDQFADLDAFAAQIAALDMVVATSNTAAHMAGALGVPTLLMLASVPDWRWQITGDAALWYPEMALFRQKDRGDWSAPIEAIAAELAKRSARLSSS